MTKLTRTLLAVSRRNFMKHCLEIKEYNLAMCSGSKISVDSTDPLFIRAVEENSRETEKPRKKETEYFIKAHV